MMKIEGVSVKKRGIKINKKGLGKQDGEREREE